MACIAAICQGAHLSLRLCGEPMLTSNADIVHALLDLGAGILVNAADDNGKTPLSYGAEEVELVRLLVKRGADINLPDKDGRTAVVGTAQGRLSIHRRNRWSWVHACNSCPVSHSISIFPSCKVPTLNPRL